MLTPLYFRFKIMIMLIYGEIIHENLAIIFFIKIYYFKDSFN